VQAGYDCAPASRASLKSFELVRRTGKSFRQSLLCGQAEHSAWAVTTSQGIIIVDALFDYSVEDEIVGGLKKLGLDPASIKYVIVSHGHIDHAGGAKYLQDHFGARIILAEEDWDSMSRNTQSWPKPKRDKRAACTNTPVPQRPGTSHYVSR
jgi:glyoxylase-like metal-dependent hydrolase (beta-lactamase superfamily II)